ncbi:hypothetical protein JCM6882_009010 [Rhodosporidiobolus microsporus]
MSIAQTLIPDVVELIAEKVADRETHRDALSFALVCKDWQDAGIKALYRNLDGPRTRAGKAISARPELAQLVRRLRLSLGPHFEGDLHLLRTLTRLQHLVVGGTAPAGSNLLKTLATLPSIPNLRILLLSAADEASEVDVASVFAILERATSLHTFLFSTPLGCDLESTVEVRTPPHRLSQLSLHHGHAMYGGVGFDCDEQECRRAQTLLLKSFDFSSLHSFATCIDLTSPTLHTLLSTASNLRSLHLRNDCAQTFLNLLPLSLTIPSLVSLRTLSVADDVSGSFGKSAPPVVGTEALLAALPPTLQHLTLLVFFAEGVTHPALSRFLDSRRVGPLETVKVWYPDDLGRNRKQLLKKERATGGEGDDPAVWQWLEVRDSLSTRPTRAS